MQRIWRGVCTYPSSESTSSEAAEFQDRMEEEEDRLSGTRRGRTEQQSRRELWCVVWKKRTSEGRGKVAQ
jgi:hypothetical protein